MQINKSRLLLVSILTLIPLGWLLFSQLEIFRGPYLRLHNLSMDLRFWVRGELPPPDVKIIYANVDGAGIAMLGERPWSRLRFAQIADYLLDHGEASVVGFDFIFSQVTHSEMVSRDAIRQADDALAAVLAKHRPIVLAANYTDIPLPPAPPGLDMDALYPNPNTRRIIPLEYWERELPEAKRITPANTFPEMPSYPLVRPDGNTNGIGLIAVDRHMGGDAASRWVPLYTESEGPYYTLNFLQGLFQHNPGVKEWSIDLFGNNLFLINPEGGSQLSLPWITRQPFLHFAVELALQHFDLDQSAVEITPRHLTVSDHNGEVIIRAPLTFGQLLEINWFSPWHSRQNPQVSIRDIFQAERNLREGSPELQAEAKAFFSQFRDAVVLVGPTDPTLQDLAPTPFDGVAVPKVSVHGNVLKTLLTGNFLHRSPEWLNILILLLFTACVAGLGIYTGPHSGWAKILALVCFCGYITFAFVAFSRWNLILPLAIPAGSAFTTTAAGALYQLILQERQKSRIKALFGNYLSPVLVNKMVEADDEPKLGGEETRVTAFFSDVQNFSTFSEKMTPPELVMLMNQYLTAMTRILMREGAYVDKYIGDAIVAMFNAPVSVPNNALLACRAALLIQQAQSDLRERWTQEGTWPAEVTLMRTRIGLNTGPAIVGNMGSEERFNYTMMGDTVNLAARCESGAKSIGVYTLATDETRAEAEQAASGEIVFRHLDQWRVKGRSQPVGMHEVLALRTDATADMLRCIEYYETGLEKYFKRQWREAADCFEESARLEPNQPNPASGIATNPSLILHARCQLMERKPPPDNWDGVFVMQGK